jgi:hypothetical protein
MKPMPAAGWLALVLVVAACTIPPLETPTSRPTASPSATQTPSPTAEASPSEEPTESASPTPDPALVPVFTAGEIVAPITDGLRLRRLPGTERAVSVDRLPTGSELTVVLGPIPADGFGWYLVTDADPDEPEFSEGWIAAGYDPDPFLASSGRHASPNPYPAGFAETGDAQFGPVGIDDEHYGLRWIAIDPVGASCTLDLSMSTASSGPIPAVRVTARGAPVPGQFFSDFFVDNPALRGQVFVSVTSDCAWALAFVRLAPTPTPAP